MFLFWLDASDRVGWADAVLAAAAAVLFVFANILVRRAERATWIARPPWYVNLLALFGAVALMFGAMYTDAFLFHRKDISSSRIQHDIVFAAVFTALMQWSSFGRRSVSNS